MPSTKMLSERNQSVKSFGDCAEPIRDVVSPKDAIGKKYVGLEHIEQDSLRLNSVGIAEDIVSKKNRFKAGDILFGKLRPYFRKVVLPDFDGICSTDVWVVRAKEGTDQRFLFYWMASQEFVDIASQGSEGTKMPRAKWDFVSKIRKKVPPLSEQKAIAEVLGALDDKIELNRKMNKTLEEMAQAIFKTWFVDFDPVKAKAQGKKPFGMDTETAALFPDSFEDSSLGKIPKGWQIKSLDEIAIFLNGLALQKFPPVGKNYLPVIKIRELKDGINANTGKASPNIAKKYIIENGDILFSWSGSLEVAIWGEGKGALNQHLFKITSINYPKWFYYQWTKKHLPEFKAIASGKATTMGHIQRHHLSSAKVIIPSPKLFKKANELFNPIIERIISNNKKNNSLINMRDALLPKLLSGEIQVKGLHGHNN